MLRRSARIRARKADVTADEFPSHSEEESESDKHWCSCGGVDDGRLMLYCDQQCEGCCVWYHYDCLGLSLSDGQKLGCSKTSFVHPHCSNSDITTPLSNGTITPVEQEPEFGLTSKFKPCTDFMWNDLNGDRACESFISAYVTRSDKKGLIAFPIVQLCVPLSSQQ